MELTWSAASDVVKWATEAKKAARTKAQRRIANVVEHCGVIVSGATRINCRLVETLRPLEFFEASAWTTEKREDSVTRIVALIEDTVVLPRVRVAFTALLSALPEIDDIDVWRPAVDMSRCMPVLPPPIPYREPGPDHILNVLLEGARPLDDQWNRSFEVYGATMDVAGAWRCVDHEIERTAPRLVHLLRTASSTEDSEHIRYLARSILARARLYSQNPFDDSPPCIPTDQKMQMAFGHLIAAQQRAFPEMPAPTWAY